MAKEKDDIEIDLEDDATVTVDLPEGVDAADEGEQEEKPVKDKKPAPRVRLQDPVDEEEDDTGVNAVAEATKALEEAQRKTQAAEATAVAERQRREAAERLAQQRAREADAARAEAESSQLTLIDKGIESAQGEVEAYKSQLTNAYETGDFKLVADIQTKLSKATATLDRLEATKEEVAAGKRPQAQETTEGRVEAPATGTAFEQYLTQFSPEAQSWLRQHPECAPSQFGGSPQANAKMMAGHYAAMAQNITPNTVDYFRVIEEHTGHRTPVSAAADVKKAEDEGTAPTVKAPKKAQVAAPPSREPLAASGRQTRSNPRSVTLSKEQQEMAKVSFPNMTDKEAFAQYAKNLLELEAEGKMGRLTH